MALPTRHKLMLIVLGGIFAVLAIMLVIALVLGDRTPNDKNNNSYLDTHSAGLPHWAQSSHSTARVAQRA